MRPRLTYPNVVATICLVAVVGGTAVAATKTSTTTITACVVKKGKTKGALRVISGKAKCKRTEKKLAWNKQGVAGAPGAKGPAGSAGADAVAPTNAVMFFASATCPVGWTDYAPAQGRYVVGLQPGGTLEKTDGTALTDGEDRPVGKHAHSVTDPGHTHTIATNPILTGGNVTVQRLQGTASLAYNQPINSALAFTGISIDPAGGVDGTNAPYVQLLACRKS
jgi:hypothetical protein